MSEERAYPAGDEPRRVWRRGGVGARIGDGRDPDAGGLKLAREPESPVIIGDDHGPFAGVHPIERDQALEPFTEEDTREIVVREDQRMLKATGRDDDPLGPHADQSIPLRRAQQAALVEAEDR